MNPAVGVTKILNNLQECINIIEEINKRNNIVLPQIENLEKISLAKNNLVNILSDGTLDNIEKIINLTKATLDIEKNTDDLSMMISRFIDHYKKLLEEIDISQDNAYHRIKLLREEERIEWFKNWKKDEHQFEVFNGIVTSYCNWEYPVMEIFPGNGDMLPFAVSGEPLYVVDWDNYLLEKVGGQFNEYYATKRLMKYEINEFDLSNLPQNSFGFIYAVNYLMFESLAGLVELAENVYNCLMPGGVYCFVYNNSDDWWSVNNSVEYYFGLVNSDDLNNALTKIGFEIIQNVKSKNLNYSYIICKKPGDIDYIKKSSILAKIIDRNRTRV